MSLHGCAIWSFKPCVLPLHKIIYAFSAAYQWGGFQSLTREVLLSACDGQPDCAFDALDARPAGTYADQVAACEALTERYVEDCAGHAAQRLLEAHPTDAAIRAAMQAPHADRLRMMLPTYMAVAGRTHCPDIGPTTATCDGEVAQEILRRNPNATQVQP